jgi:hypothetical protein
MFHIVQNKCAHSYSNLIQFFLQDALEPISEQVGYILWWCQTEKHINDAPKNLSKWTINEKMLYGFLAITKTTRFISCLATLDEIILG